MHQPQSPAHPVRAREGSACRPKVVPLRCLPRPTSADDPPTAGGHETIVDLQAPIDCLRSIKSDLEVYYWEQTGDEALLRIRRDQVMFWVRVIADRTAALEGLVFQKGSPRLSIRGLPPGEHEAVLAAARALDHWISEDEAFAQVADTIGRILAAADRIGMDAAAGTPLPRLDHPGTS